MQQAIDTDAISQEQYSRPGCSTIDHALNMRLTSDHNAFQRSSFALACSNLKSCYNRFVNAVVFLVLQWLGLPLEFIVGMLDSIQTMVHNFCTGFGDSTLTYGGRDIPEAYKHYLQGLNQGNRAGPIIWSIVSSTIFKIL